MKDVIHKIFKEDFDEAKEKAVNQEQQRVASDMLAMNLPLSMIEKISKLSAETIRSLADSLGIAVVN